MRKKFSACLVGLPKKTRIWVKHDPSGTVSAGRCLRQLGCHLNLFFPKMESGTPSVSDGNFHGIPHSSSSSSGRVSRNFGSKSEPTQNSTGMEAEIFHVFIPCNSLELIVFCATKTKK